MRKPDPHLPLVFTRADAYLAGLTKNQVDGRVATGRWKQLSRGAYCLESAWQEADPGQRQVIRVTGALKTVSYPAFASHASAAALLDLPVPSRGPAWVTRLPPASTRYSEDLTVEVASVRPRDRWTKNGLPLTSLRRTAADCARHLQPPDGLAVLDAAVRRQPGLLEDIGLVLEDCVDWPYVANAGLLMPLVDGRRESALESWSYYCFHACKIPLPEPQVDIYDEFGTFVGRADAWWDEFGVAGEADGKTKYLGLASPEEAKQAVYDEKLREDAFRRTGAGIVRWEATGLGTSRWARRILHELHTHGPSRFRGRAVRRPRIV